MIRRRKIDDKSSYLDGTMFSNTIQQINKILIISNDLFLEFYIWNVFPFKVMYCLIVSKSA